MFYIENKRMELLSYVGRKKAHELGFEDRGEYAIWAQDNTKIQYLNSSQLERVCRDWPYIAGCRIKYDPRVQEERPIHPGLLEP